MENKIPAWRKLVDELGNWVGVERTEFMTVEEAIKLGYTPLVEKK